MFLILAQEPSIGLARLERIWAHSPPDSLLHPALRFNRTPCPSRTPSPPSQLDHSSCFVAAVADGSRRGNLNARAEYPWFGRKRLSSCGGCGPVMDKR